MKLVIAFLLFVIAIRGAAIAALLVRGMRRARAEQSLHDSEERFRLMADRAPVMMWTARPNTTLDFINHTWVEFSGLWQYEANAGVYLAF